MSKPLIPKRGEIWEVRSDLSTSRNPLVVIASIDQMASLGIHSCVPIVPRKPEHDEQMWEFLLEQDNLNNLVQPSSASTHLLRPIPDDNLAAKFGQLDADVFDAMISLIAFNMGFSGY